MSLIVPTVTAYDMHEYRRQIELVSGFSKRIHIDLMDGIFAPTRSPELDKLWLPDGVKCDVHLMFQHPHLQLNRVKKLDPHLVIIPAEASPASVDEFELMIKKTKIKLGIALLPETNLHDPRIKKLIKRADHVLIFSGHLGFHGGIADLTLLGKIPDVLTVNSSVEIGWDGGINLKNVTELSKAGTMVLNTGAAIQGALDPLESYCALSNAVTGKKI